MMSGATASPTSSKSLNVNIAYGGVMLALFGNPRSLLRYSLPLTNEGFPPQHHTVQTNGVKHFDQGTLPICTAVAATTLVSLAYASLGQRGEDPAPAFTYLAGSQLVKEHEDISIESQLEGGLPLAACVEAVCLSGILPRRAVPTPDDPVALQLWMQKQGLNLETLGHSYAQLPGDFRAIRLFPSEDNLKAALVGAKAIAFSFRIDSVLDTWMRSPVLQLGSGYRIPPASEVGPRIATHACVIVGFDNREQAFRVRNSFGVKWGLEGDFWIQYGTMLRPSFSAGEFYVIG